MALASSPRSNPVALRYAELDELKKVWAILNPNGVHQLGLHELGMGLKIVSGAQPELNETRELFEAMANSSGTITFNDFSRTILSYISKQETISNTSGLNRSSSGGNTSIDNNEERKKFHLKVADFFLHFKKADFSNLKQQRLRIANSIQTTFSDAEIQHQNHKQTEFEKAKQLARSLTEILTTLHQSIGGNDIRKATECIRRLADLLSILKLFNEPEDRIQIAEFLVPLFYKIRDSKVATVIISCLKEKDAPQLQFQSARFIRYYCQGPRIPNCPRESSLHPDSLYHKSVCIENGAVESLIKLMNHRETKIKSKAAEALGRIASHDAKARQYVISKGIFDKLLKSVDDKNDIEVVASTTETIAILLGETHKQPLLFDTNSAKIRQQLAARLTGCFKGIISYMSTLYKQHHDLHLATSNAMTRNSSDPLQQRINVAEIKKFESALINVISCLSYLITALDDQTWEAYVRLITFNNANIQIRILDTLTSILMMDVTKVSQFIAKFKLFALLAAALKDDNVGVRSKALEVVIVIVQASNELIMGSEANFVKPLMDMLLTDDLCRIKVVKILRHLTTHTVIASKLVTQYDIVTTLGKALVSFKKYDPILKAVYRHVGPCYNFEFVSDVIETLINILNKGDMPNGNRFIQKFDMALLDSIGDVVMKMSQTRGIQAWKTFQNKTLQQSINDLLIRIANTHQRCNTSLRFEVQRYLNDLQSNFQQSIQSNQQRNHQLPSGWEFGHWSQSSLTLADYGLAQTQIRLRLELNGKVRDNEYVNRDIRYAQLQNKLANMVGAPVQIYTTDGFGNMTFIRDDLGLSNAIFRAQWNTVNLSLKVVNWKDNSNYSWGGWYDFGNFNDQSYNANNNWSNNSNNWFNENADSNMNDSIETTNAINTNSILQRWGQKTGLSLGMVQKLWGEFESKRNNNSQLNMAGFCQIMQISGQYTDNAQIELLFKAFGYSKQTLDWGSFIEGFAIIHQGTNEQKVKLAFRTYDLNHNNRISKQEFYNTFKTIIRGNTVNSTEQGVREYVENVFSKYDGGNKGYLDFGEFVKLVDRRRNLVTAFGLK